LSVLAAWGRPSPGDGGPRLGSMGLLGGVPALSVLLCVGLWAAGLSAEGLGIRPILLVCACLATFASMFANRPAAFGTMALLWFGLIVFGRFSDADRLKLAARSFFGVYRVVDAPDHDYRVLLHGSTTHGSQELPARAMCEPTGYYHRSGPIGQLFSTETTRFEHVAVVGLGTGALACYAQPDGHWTFYEIDPLVERIARDPRYFTYLQNSRSNLNVVLGDGRLTLQRAGLAAYDLIILDAFSSDAIPVHLLTKEAVELYVSRLQPDGILAVHISNRYMNLEPLVAAVGQQNGLFGLVDYDKVMPDSDAKKGRLASIWMMLARTRESLARLSSRPGWRLPTTHPRLAPWTDDYSNILQVLAIR